MIFALHEWIALGMAGGIGLSLGLLGAGGSILSLPILVYVALVPVRAALPMSLAVVGVTSFIASLTYRFEGNQDTKTALFFAGCGIISAFIGARVSHLLSERIILVLFALLMLWTGIKMFLKSRDNGQDEVPAEDIPYSGVVALGFTVGFLTGLLGIGGGFLIIPALVLGLKMPMRRAVGTGLLITAINCVSGFLSHWSQAIFSWWYLGVFVLCASLGIFAGKALSKKCSTATLQKAFSAMVLSVGVFVLLKNI